LNNRYHYVDNKPLQRIDPTGLYSINEHNGIDGLARPSGLTGLAKGMDDFAKGCGFVCSCTLLCPPEPNFVSGLVDTTSGGLSLQGPTFGIGPDGSISATTGVQTPTPGQTDRPGRGAGAGSGFGDTAADKAFVAAMIAAAALRGSPSGGGKPPTTTPKGSNDCASDADSEHGKPIRRVYNANSKHRNASYFDAKGREVSRQPRGSQADWQSILDCSTPNGPRHRLGVEPSTGKSVELRQELRQEFDSEIVEYYHGFVPGG
jgi:hypothetical protein